VIEIEKKKMKDGYPKLTIFKVWIPYFKSDEKILGVRSEVFPSFFIFKNFSVIKLHIFLTSYYLCRLGFIVLNP
jgi:hypothetical protein